ncbi:hypothetical protein SI859A1_02152 [Aurantimonas manganoxydans SI85-9A1]|uniref:Curlin associated repeat-containing protein n=2 Tax=Aurantimonas manganoxydans TaxID=651183 RepID=Q1YMP4_AURMS|nr:hypothetical protein SI859A1_02152 [Aurantimonas manganoxydans SI85-9A1]
MRPCLTPPKAARPSPSSKEPIMKKSLKATLLSASILALGAGSAFADDNDAFTLQSGTDNTALIQQSGSGNQGGLAPVAQNATQAGSGNMLSIKQLGSTSQVGTGTLGVDQTGTMNKLTIIQFAGSSGNAVLNVQQTANFTTNSTSTNVASVSQTGGTGNVVDTISQTMTAAGPQNFMTIVQDGSSNGVGGFQRFSLAAEFAAQNGLQLASVSQSGANNNFNYRADGNSNQFAVRQTGGNTSLVASVVGDSNQLLARQANGAVATATIAGDSNALVFNQGGAGIIADVTITGDLNNSNGLGGFSGDARSAAYGFQRPGLIQQFGSNQLVSLDVDGDSNRFSVNQANRGNRATGSIAGDGNQAVVNQDGVSNTATFSQVGSGNTLGVRQ